MHYMHASKLLTNSEGVSHCTLANSFHFVLKLLMFYSINLFNSSFNLYFGEHGLLK